MTVNRDHKQKPYDRDHLDIKYVSSFMSRPRAANPCARAAWSNTNLTSKTSVTKRARSAQTSSALVVRLKQLSVAIALTLRPLHAFG
jgi:hypothetical protein